MIQRKQTLFLAVAFVLTAVCLCSRVAVFSPNNFDVDTEMFNLWIQNPNGTVDWTVVPLLGVLFASMVITIFTVFAYDTRKLQANLCLWNVLVNIVWYILFAVYIKKCMPEPNMTLHIDYVVVLPAITMVLQFMARKGIKHDDELLRAAERIR